MAGARPGTRRPAPATGKLAGRPRRALAAATLGIAAMAAGAGARTVGETYTNPLLPSGADPWVTQRHGYYYYTDTQGDRIALWKTRDMARLGQAPSTVVWRAPASGPDSDVESHCANFERSSKNTQLVVMVSSLLAQAS